jgi:hypothetical protein
MKSFFWDKIPDARLAGSVWQSFAAADWVDFDDIEQRFQQVRVGWVAVGLDVTSGPVPQHTAEKLALLLLLEAQSFVRLAGSVWQSFSAAGWVNFVDNEKPLQQVQPKGS